MTAAVFPFPAGAPDNMASDSDALFAAFMERAKALPPGSVGAADALAADAAVSTLPVTTFKPLAAAIGKATGLDTEAIRKAIAKGRGARDGAASDTGPAGAPLGCMDDPEPAVSPQPLSDILDALVKLVVARVHCPPETADAVALWCVGTWGVYPPCGTGGPDLYPRLQLSSPTKRCGKSTLLEIVQHGVRRPLAATDTSAAAMFRAVDRWRPTVVIDEADQLFSKNPELVGLANSGYARTGYVLRTVEVQTQGGKSFEPVAFPSFAPVAYAGIGSLAATLEDRSVRVALQRQPHGLRRQRIGLARLAQMRGMLAPHLMAHADAIGAAMTVGVPDSAIPAALNDRDADNWRPLLALARLAGGHWPARAVRAASALCVERAESDRGAEWALAQIAEAVTTRRREAVEQIQQWRRSGKPKTGLPVNRTVAPALAKQSKPRPCRFIASDELAAWLWAKDDSGFGDLRDIGAVKLRVARVLRPFGARPVVRKIGGQAVRGYDVPALRAVWRRYRP